MKMKIVAFLAFLLNTFLFGSYYSVAKEALGRIDPIVFTFFVMTALLPLALCLLVISWQDLSREIIKSGAMLGSCLCLGLFMLSVALKYNSAASTAFFPSLNGFLAACCAWLFLRQPISKVTWLAGVISACGAVLLILNSTMGGARGALIAFIGGLFCTFYVFLADHEQRGKKATWALFGVQLLTMSLWANLLALLFGDWQAVHPSLPRDIWIVLYIALGTTCLPVFFTVVLQKYLAPLTVSFIYILEPVFGVLVAYSYLHEVLPPIGYGGGLLIVLGAVLNTWGTAERPADNRPAMRQRLSLTWSRFNGSVVAALGYPLLWLCPGVYITYHLGGLPPASWRLLLTLAPAFPVAVQQGHTRFIGETILVATQSFAWLVAWVALAGIIVLVLYRAAKFPSAVAATRRSRGSGERWETPAQVEVPLARELPRYYSAPEPRHYGAPHRRGIPKQVEAPLADVFADDELWDTPTVQDIHALPSVELLHDIAMMPDTLPTQEVPTPAAVMMPRQVSPIPAPGASVRRKDEKPLVQRRRRQRSMRLAQIELVE